MKLRTTEFITDLGTILNELKSQLELNEINLLRDIRPSGDNNIQVTCIYHADGQERKPSAGIRTDTGVYHCFACQETHQFDEFVSNCFGRNDGGMFGWSWLLKNFLTIDTEEDRNVELNFGDSNNSVADIHSIRINGTKKNTLEDRRYVTEEELDSYRYIHPYLEKRGIVDEEIIELFDIGYDKSNHSITFPIRDIYGNCLFIARRNVNTKFFNYPKGVEKPLYGLYELSQIAYMNPVEYKSEIVEYEDKQGKVYPIYKHSATPVFTDIFVCESMIDCILLWQSGHCATALNGLGNQLQFQQLRDLPCRHLILCTDNDDAGMRARQKIKKNVRNKLFSEILFPVGIKDVGECTREQVDNIRDWEEYI